MLLLALRGVIALLVGGSFVYWAIEFMTWLEQKSERFNKLSSKNLDNMAVIVLILGSMLGVVASDIVLGWNP